MTLKELENLKNFPKEIKATAEYIAKLKRQAESASHTLSGMPSSKGKKDYIGDAIAISIDEQEKLRRLIFKQQKEQARIMAFIQDIPDSQLRTVFILRFLRGYSWVRVALEIGGGNTEAAVKKQVQRYLAKCEKGKKMSADKTVNKSFTDEF